MCSCSLIAFILGRSRRIVPIPSSTCRVTNSGAAMCGPPGADDVVARTLVRTEPLLCASPAQAVEDGAAQESLDVPRCQSAEADAVRRGHDEPPDRGENPLGGHVDPEVPRLLPPV